MALPMIETGYKPEFGLGALYQGFNAANADQSAQEEIIKQFLANQREQSLQPIDIAQHQQNLDAGQYKTSPEYQTGMRDTISGQGMSNLVAGQNATVLQPFKQAADRRESQNQFERADQQNSIYQLDNLIQTEQNPLQRMALMKERERMTRNLRETPEFTGKRELRETGTDSAEYIAELRAMQAREAARMRGAGSENKDTAEQAAVRKLKEQLASQEIDLPTYEAAIASIINKKFAKPEQQGIKPIIGADGQIDLGNKASTPQYIPPSQAKPALPSGWTMK